MKKLTLLFATGLCVAPAFAQYQSSSMLLQQATGAVKHEMNIAPRSFGARSIFSANKTTTGLHEGWFSYIDVMYKSGTTKGWYTEVYQDSTVRGYDASTSTYYNLGTFGMGMSFDPTSEVYESAFNNLQNIPGWVVGTDKLYELDSVYINGWYERKPYNNYTDTLMVEVVRTGNPNVSFKRQYGPSAAEANINTLDSVARFATTIYDPINNKVSDSVPVSEKRTWIIPMDTGFFADSFGHSHSRALALTTPLQVSAGEKLITYVHFKSGHTYPFNKSIDSVNNFHIYTYEIDGANTYPKQYGKGKDVTTLLWATKQSKYGTGSGPFTVNGHNALIPILAYNDPTGIGFPDNAFYLKCTNCENAGVKNITGIISSVTAYPNPAGNMVRIPVTVSKAASVQVSLVNTLGQQVSVQDLGKVGAGQTATANFSTNNLPSGVWVYIVNADGQRMTGRIVITH